MERRRFTAICAAALTVFPFPADAGKRRRRKKKQKRSRQRDDIPDHPVQPLHSRPIQVSGNGASTTDPFVLEVGPHLASVDLYGWDYTGRLFSVGLHNELGIVDYLFIESPMGYRGYRFERSFEVQEGGSYFLKVEIEGGHWHAAIVPKCVPPDLSCPPLPPPIPPLEPPPPPPA